MTRVERWCVVAGREQRTVLLVPTSNPTEHRREVRQVRQFANFRAWILDFSTAIWHIVNNSMGLMRFRPPVGAGFVLARDILTPLELSAVDTRGLSFGASHTHGLRLVTLDLFRGEQLP